MDTAQEVTDLEIKARQLQAEDRFFDALNALEEALSIQKDMHGVNSVQFTRTCKQVCQTCNVLAVHFLRSDDIDQALKLLRRSEALSQTNQLCRAMTFNNIACYYRRIGKLKTALNYLQKALAIETQLPKVETQADTHLNVCAVLSQLNKHDIALTHAMSAVALLQQEQLKRQFGLSPEIDFEQDDLQSVAKLKRDRASVLAIAYHNMGVQQEFLKAYDNALLSYRKAVLYAQQNLGHGDSITTNLRNVYENARQELREMGGKLVKKKASTTGYPAGQLQGLAAQAAPVYARKELLGYPGSNQQQQQQQLPYQQQHYAYHQSGYKIPPQQYHPGPAQTSDGDADYNDSNNAKQQEEYDENQQSRLNNRQIDDMMTSRDNIREQDKSGDNQQEAENQTNQLDQSQDRNQEVSQNISKN